MRSLLAVLLVLLVPAAQAAIVAQGQVTADRMEATRPFHSDGGLGFAYGTGSRAGTFDLALHAARVTVWEYHDDYLETNAGGFRQTTRGASMVGEAQPQAVVWSDVQMHVSGRSLNYTFSLFASGATVAADGSGVEVSCVPDPYLTRDGIRDMPPPGAPALDALKAGADERFTKRSAGQAELLASADHGRLELVGDYTLEAYGLQFSLSSRDGSASFTSGRSEEPMAPGAPSTVHQVRDGFLRFQVEQGALAINVTQALALQWTQERTVLRSAGVELLGASGAVTLPDGSVQLLSGGALELEGPVMLAGSATERGVSSEITGLDGQGAPLAIASVQAELPRSMAVTLAIAFTILGAAGLAILLLMRRQRPTMPDVEAALEAGHYRAAARLAKRVLRRRPSEDATLSRAIALSKAGQARRVVRELEDHLQSAPPSDGALHYVLGLAHLDLDHSAAAQAAFTEAVRRTPSLAGQVASRLGGLPAGAVPKDERESSAYT